MSVRAIYHVADV